MPKIFLIISGLAAGITIGTGIAALLALLDIIPRLAQLTRSYKYIWLYESAFIFGATFFSIMDLLNVKLYLNSVILIILGSFMGVYIGLITAALAELINVIPVMVRRSNLTQYAFFILLAIIIGKVTGSLIYWLFPNIR